jgi:hypothetical protein
LLFVNDAIEKTLQVVFVEGWLQTCHCVESDTETPDVAPLIVALILDYLW